MGSGCCASGPSEVHQQDCGPEHSEYWSEYFFQDLRITSPGKMHPSQGQRNTLAMQRVDRSKQNEKVNIEEVPVLLFPKNSQLDVISVYRKDLESLEPSKKITDTIIDLFLKLFFFAKSDQQFLFCSSLLFHWFHIGETPFRDSSFKHLNIFDGCKYFFIPINWKNSHWFLAVLINPGEHPTSNTPPRILILDSDINERIYGKFLTLLYGFLNVIDHKFNNTRNFSAITAPSIVLPAPQQRGVFNCGIHMLLNVQSFLQNPPTTMTNEALSDWSSKYLTSSLRQISDFRDEAHIIINYLRNPKKQPNVWWLPVIKLVSADFFFYGPSQNKGYQGRPSGL